MAHRKEARHLSGTPRLATASLAALAALGGLAGLAGCGEPEDRSLCRVYDDYLEAADAVAAVDVADTSAQEAADVVEEALGTVRHLGEVADDRYTEPIENLELAIEDLLRVLSSVPDDTPPQIWAPLVEDSVEDVVIAATRVTRRIDPACRPDA